MPSIFSKIISGQIPSYKIAEDENYFSFLDIAPLTKGHTLVIPKKEVDYIFDLDNETYLGLMNFSKRVAVAIKKSIDCSRVSLQVIGLEVPHAHVHLIPINTMSDCNFSKPKIKLRDEEFIEIANSISKNFI
ncbi:MAG: HIT family protein [Bacteroidota bacterium]|nr:HIT family protein [Bacteroidota bacterium]MDP3146553.1 HIT family protein [Bacteroidota bacterium]